MYTFKSVKNPTKQNMSYRRQRDHFHQEKSDSSTLIIEK